MFAKSTQKKLILAVLLSGALMAPAEAKGWKFHIAGTKVELGNRGPITVQTPGGKPVGVPIIPATILGGSVLVPTIFGAAVVSSVSDWLSAPKDIRASIDAVPRVIVDVAKPFYEKFTDFVGWFKNLVTTYGPIVVLGLAGTIFISAITGAQIVGYHIRKGLLAASEVNARHSTPTV